MAVFSDRLLLPWKHFSSGILIVSLFESFPLKDHAK